MVAVNVAAVPLITVLLLAVSVMAVMGTGFNDVIFVVELLPVDGSFAPGVATLKVAESELPFFGVMMLTITVVLAPAANELPEVNVAAATLPLPNAGADVQPGDTDTSVLIAGDQFTVNCWLGRLEGQSSSSRRYRCMLSNFRRESGADTVMLTSAERVMLTLELVLLLPGTWSGVSALMLALKGLNAGTAVAGRLTVITWLLKLPATNVGTDNCAILTAVAIQPARHSRNGERSMVVVNHP